MRKSQLFPFVLIIFVISSCGGGTSSATNDNAVANVPTVAPLFGEIESDTEVEETLSNGDVVETDLPEDITDKLLIVVDAAQNVHPISPLIYGVSGADSEVLQALQPTVNSWGGNPSTRYNWELGNAWNAGSDWEYRNGNYGYEGSSASDDFIEDSQTFGAAVRLAVPTLGWVARNDDNDTCSFPLPNGGCGDAGGATCDSSGEQADPTVANVESNVDSIVDWMNHLNQQGHDVRFVAMDNEPELWGITHYDIHPECTTYEEVLDKYKTYAAAVHAVVPDVEITAPAICCWFDYWDFAPGPVDTSVSSEQDFLSWFLDNVREFDAQLGERTLDVMDVHYYPEGVFNDDVDANTAAQRLRSTRSLWDKSYTDESWIGKPIYFIPRMKDTIANHYPETKLGISEWNWGADESMNGALAIADVLGIYGREDVYFASYWRYPPLQSPGYFAFKLYTNFDDENGRFGDTSILAQSNDIDAVSSYAALNSKTGDLHVILINKQPESTADILLQLNNFSPSGEGILYRYDQTELEQIQTETVVINNTTNITLPAYSITLLVLSSQ